MITLCLKYTNMLSIFDFSLISIMMNHYGYLIYFSISILPHLYSIILNFISYLFFNFKCMDKH